MIMTKETLLKIINTLRASYGAGWRPDITTDSDAFRGFGYDCQLLIPDELAFEMVLVYRTRRDFGPHSAHEILTAYTEKPLEEASPCKTVVDTLLSELQRLTDDHLGYTDSTCRAYLRCNVIPKFKCSDGVDAFYMNNELTLWNWPYLSAEDREKKYNSLSFDYKKQLCKAERQAVLTIRGPVALPGGSNLNQLEA